MTTTVQVDEKTLKTLAALKQQLKARSYQEVIEYLVNLRMKGPPSIFGVAKGSKHYSHEHESEHAI